MMRRDYMRSQTVHTRYWNLRSLFLLTAGVLASGVILHSAPKSKQSSVKQQGFATPEAAAQALIQSAGKYDVPALLEILGPDAGDLVASEDPVADKNRVLAFAT